MSHRAQLAAGPAGPDRASISWAALVWAAVNSAAGVSATTVILNGLTTANLVGDTITFGTDPTVYSIAAVAQGGGNTTVKLSPPGLAVAVTVGANATVIGPTSGP